MAQLPYLRVLAGLVFVLAGLFGYYGITFGASIALLLVIAGAIVIVITLAGHRAYPVDIAVFVVALVILGGVASGYGISVTKGASVIQYTSIRTQATRGIDQIDLLVGTNSSSINVQFSDNSSLLYQVRLVRGSSAFPSFLIFPSVDTYKLTNQTRGGTLLLNVSASFRSIFVTLPSGYLTNMNVSTGAGSITILTSHEESLGYVSLSTGAGSIDANISSNRIRGIDLSTGAGTVSLSSSYLGPNGSKIPISISTGTGSANLNVRIPSNASVSLDASTGIGSISHNLSSSFVISESSNFQLIASEGNASSAAQSFQISISTGAGSISINARTI